MQIDTSTGAVDLGVDVYTKRSEKVDCSAGVKLSSDGSASASIIFRF